jgi:hypothetical protein
VASILEPLADSELILGGAQQQGLILGVHATLSTISIE